MVSHKLNMVDFSYFHQAYSANVRACKLHVYGKRQTSDSSLEFPKIENKQIKAAQNKGTNTSNTFKVGLKYPSW